MSALARNYNRRKISFIRGRGSFLYSTDGKKYLDFIQGIAVNSLGHANPKLIRAINKQAKKVWQTSNAFLIPNGERLAKKLTQRTFADKIIFQNSGAEATEASMKVARRYFYSIGKPKKNKILCIKNNIEQIEFGRKGILFSFYKNIPKYPEKILKLGLSKDKQITIRSDQKVFYDFLGNINNNRFVMVKNIIKKFH